MFFERKQTDSAVILCYNRTIKKSGITAQYLGRITK